jgi:anti-sigma factor ChrR (cupin superfamily)
MANTTAYWQELYQQSQEVNLENTQVEHMEVNHNLHLPALVNTSTAKWLPSPAKGVKRLMLEREGGEKVIRATSIVAYAPNSKFSAHAHPKGEEFFVLFGTFSDEHGDYPAGTYVRNPSGSSHKPYSQEGCLIWVKLQQFDPLDKQHIVIDIDKKVPKNSQQNKSQNILFSQYEQVEMVSTDRDVELPIRWLDNGLEVLVLAGEVVVDNTRYQQGQWLRLPSNIGHSLIARQHSKLLIKHGHLA